MSRGLPAALDLCLGLLMLAGVGLNFSNVVSRYVFASPIFWAEEVLVLITIWGVFLGMVLVAWRGEHLGIDVLPSGLPRGLGLIRNGVVALATAGICGFVAIHSWQIVSMFYEGGAVSVGAGIPRAVPHSALLWGFGMTTAVVLIRMRCYLSGDFRS